MKSSALCLASLVAKLVKKPSAVQEKPSSIPGLESSPGVRDRLPTPVFLGFPGTSDGKESACSVGVLGLIPESEDPLEKGMATHSSILAWRTPWTEEPGGLQSMGHKESTQLTN